ncbi:MAG: hypothetical protein ACOCZ9_02795, partial [Spirochaetota bacterium]
MKRACCAVAGVFFLFVSAGIVFAQSPGGQDGRVDRRIASPSYGLNLGFFAVEYEVSEDETESETVAMPGF